MLYVCHLYLVTYTDVQHDFHIRECPCRITLPRRVSLVEQELIRFPEQVSSSLNLHEKHTQDKVIISRCDILL